jgi:hypothetical protein
MIETTYTNNLSKTLNNQHQSFRETTLGASIANDNERVGYKDVNKQICDTKYHYRSEKRFSHYLVTYKYNNNVTV